MKMKVSFSRREILKGVVISELKIVDFIDFHSFLIFILFSLYFSYFLEIELGLA